MTPDSSQKSARLLATHALRGRALTAFCAAYAAASPRFAREGLPSRRGRASRRSRGFSADASPSASFSINSSRRNIRYCGTSALAASACSSERTWTPTRLWSWQQGLLQAMDALTDISDLCQRPAGARRSLAVQKLRLKPGGEGGRTLRHAAAPYAKPITGVEEIREREWPSARAPPSTGQRSYSLAGFRRCDFSLIASPALEGQTLNGRKLCIKSMRLRPCVC